LGHARFENVFVTVQDGMKRLFDPAIATFRSGTGYTIYIQTISGSDPTGLNTLRSQANAVAYAAVYDMHDIATFLIVDTHMT